MSKRRRIDSEDIINDHDLNDEKNKSRLKLNLNLPKLKLNTISKGDNSDSEDETYFNEKKEDKKEKKEDKKEDKKEESRGRKRANSEGSLENEKIDNFDEKCHMYNLGDLDLEADNVNLGSKTKKENKEMTELFKKIKLQLYDNTVTIDNILSLKNINEIDKLKLVEKYCIMKNNENNLEEYIKYRDILKEDIKKITSMTAEEIKNKEKLEIEVKKLESLNKITFDLKEKIIKMNISDQYKSIVYDKYKMLEEMSDKDTEYFKLKHWILQVLNIPFNNSVQLHINNTNDFLKHIKIKLDADLVGMKKVKEELMLQIINRFILITNIHFNYFFF